MKSKKCLIEKPINKNVKNFEDKNAFYIQNKNDINLLRTSLPLSFFKSKNYNTEEHSNVNSSSSKNVNGNESSKILNTETKEEEKNEKNENDEEGKNIKKYKYNRMCSSNVILTEDQFNINNTNQEEDNKNENKEVKGFLRFSSKKAATVGGSLSKINNLEMKLFNYQEEQKDNNYIIKTKKSGPFLNFIDIDLFLQYIALGKNFFDNEEDNTNLIEGFCLQYQIFILPETLINKIISCFNYFYSQFLNKDQEEKTENKDNDNESQKNKTNDKEKENNNSLNEGNTFIIRKGADNNEESLRKIPLGLIDFLYTFIKLHNTYYHNIFSNLLIVKINDFLKRLTDINEIKDKYEQIIDLSQIELKEYEATIKVFEPSNQNMENIEDLSSSSDFYSDDEKSEKKDNKEHTKNIKTINGKSEDNEKDNNEYDKKKGKSFKKGIMLGINKTFKLSSSKILKQAEFMNIYEEEITNSVERLKGKYKSKDEKIHKKDEKEEKKKPYEFDISHYKTQDIASELTRVNYILFSRIKVNELLKGAFNGKDKFKSSPYICRIIKRFNSISSWVIEEILAYDHAEKRAQILLKFIHICALLKKIGNFDDCLSIMTGLTNFNINKLYKTWGHITSTDMTLFRGLKKLLNFEDNWKNLRNEIDKRIEENAFFIPYLGYYTKRMLFLEEMGPYIKNNTSLINIEKIVEVYKVLKNFYKLRNVKNCGCNCRDEDVKKELEILQCLEPSNEDFLIETSNLLEPKFVLSHKKLNTKRRTKTDINFLNNLKKVNIL